MTDSARLLLAAAVALCAACSQSSRGSEAASPDGSTYLSIAELEPGCTGILVDGGVWHTPVGTPGAISPGEHVVKCNTQFKITVRQGMVYSLNSWGP